MSYTDPVKFRINPCILSPTSVKFVIARVRGAALTLVNEAMTEGFLLSTSLPLSIHPSTTLPLKAPPPPNRRWGGRVVEG